MSGWFAVAGFLILNLICLYFGPYRWCREAEARLTQARQRAALVRISEDAWLISHDAVLKLLNPAIQHHFYYLDREAPSAGAVRQQPGRA